MLIVSGRVVTGRRAEGTRSRVSSPVAFPEVYTLRRAENTWVWINIWGEMEAGTLAFPKTRTDSPDQGVEGGKTTETQSEAPEACHVGGCWPGASGQMNRWAADGSPREREEPWRHFWASKEGNAERAAGPEGPLVTEDQRGEHILVDTTQRDELEAPSIPIFLKSAGTRRKWESSGFARAKFPSLRWNRGLKWNRGGCRKTQFCFVNLDSSLLLCTHNSFYR